MTDDPLSRKGYRALAIILLAWSIMTPKITQITDYKLPELDHFAPQLFVGQFDSPTILQKSLGSLTGSTIDDYSQEWYEGVRMSELLDCLWFNESSRGKYMYGDYWNGKPLAYGHYQVWLHIHDISYACAMDLECSTQYTAAEIRAGRGWQWSQYDYCLTSGK